MHTVKTLEQILKKDSVDFVENLFDKHVTIYQKLKGRSFCVKVTSNGFEFFKKRHVPITKIDRLLMRGYEHAISHFNNLNVLVLLPEITQGTTLFFELFDNDPKIVLTYAEKQGERVSIEELKKYSEKLRIIGPPVLFSGKLDSNVKTKILDFIYSPKTGFHFTDFIISILGLQPISVLGDHHTENIMFKFEAGGKPVLASLMDRIINGYLTSQPEISQEAKTEYKKLHDIYAISLIDIIVFMTRYYREINPNPSYSTYEERYIDYISKAFLLFIEKHGGRYEGLEFETPDFMKSSAFDINYDMITSKKVKEILEKSEEFVQLYKIFIAAFTKKKNTSKIFNPLLSKKYIEQQNTLIELIQSKIQKSFSDKSLDKVVKESKILTYDNYLGVFEDTQADDEYYSLSVSAQDTESRRPMAGNPASHLVFWQKYYDIDSEKQEEKPNFDQGEYNLVISSFNPFHLGHETAINNIYQKTGLPCILLQIEPDEPYTEDQNFQKDIFSLVQHSNDYIKRVEYNESPNIFKIIKSYADANIKIKNVSASKDRLQEWALQFDSLEDELPQWYKDIQFVYVDPKNPITSSFVKKCIKEDNYKKFKEIMPSYLVNFYEKFKQSINK